MVTKSFAICYFCELSFYMYLNPTLYRHDCMIDYITCVLICTSNRYIHMKSLHIQHFTKLQKTISYFCNHMWNLITGMYWQSDIYNLALVTYFPSIKNLKKCKNYICWLVDGL